jgi:hypothetical protein
MCKKFLALLMFVLSLSALGQGIVDFANTPSTLVTMQSEGFFNGTGFISGVEAWYFALLTSSNATGPFVFTGIYATNSATAIGRFVNNGVAVPPILDRVGPSNYVSVPIWAPGTFRYYMVAGWLSSLGPGFNPAWLYGGGDFRTAFSSVGSGIAGGTDSQGRPWPPLRLFGGTGITEGFSFCCLLSYFHFFNPSVADGAGFGFQFNAGPPAAASLVIEASTNLAPQSWIPVQTLPMTNATMYFSDPEWTNYPNRFYRLRTEPRRPGE